MADDPVFPAELVRAFKTKVNVLRCTRLWLWIESCLGREVLRHYMKSKSERLNDGHDASRWCAVCGIPLRPESGEFHLAERPVCWTCFTRIGSQEGRTDG